MGFDASIQQEVSKALTLPAIKEKLEAQGVKLAVPYRQVPALGIAIAFITDPWGTYIELTEGLDKVN